IFQRHLALLRGESEGALFDATAKSGCKDAFRNASMSGIKAGSTSGSFSIGPIDMSTCDTDLTGTMKVDVSFSVGVVNGKPTSLSYKFLETLANVCETSTSKKSCVTGTLVLDLS